MFVTAALARSRWFGSAAVALLLRSIWGDICFFLSLVTFSAFTLLCNHHRYLVQNTLISLKGNLVPIMQSIPVSSPPSPWQPLICLLSPWICLFWIFHRNGVTQVRAKVNPIWLRGPQPIKGPQAHWPHHSLTASNDRLSRMRKDISLGCLFSDSMGWNPSFCLLWASPDPTWPSIWKPTAPILQWGHSALRPELSHGI